MLDLNPPAPFGMVNVGRDLKRPVVTPGGDPVSLFVLSIPLCLFYEASIWIARLMLRRRSAATPAA